MKCQCGSNKFIKRMPTRGVTALVMEFHGDEYQVIDTQFEHVYHDAPKFIRCTKCNKRHKNPQTN